MSGFPSSGVTKPHPLDTLNHLHLPLRLNPVDDVAVVEEPQLFSADRSRSIVQHEENYVFIHENARNFFSLSNDILTNRILHRTWRKIENREYLH